MHWIKQISKELSCQRIPLLLMLSGACMIFVFISGITVREVYLLGPGQAQERISERYLQKSNKDQRIFYYSANILWDGYRSATLTLVPDDCLEQLLINGIKYPLSSTVERHDNSLCNVQDGVTLDLKTYLKFGQNTLRITVVDTVKNSNTGLSIEPGIMRGSIRYYGLILGSFFLIAAIWSFGLRICKICLWWQILSYASLSLIVYQLLGANLRDTPYDMGAHMWLMGYYANHWWPQPVGDGWLSFHPPLYYCLGAILLRMELFFGLTSYSLVRVFSVALYLTFQLFALRTMTLSKGDDLIKFALVVAMLFWPSTDIHSMRINNDLLLYALWSSVIYFFFRYLLERNNRDLQYSLIFTALATISKANGVVLLLSILLSIVSEWAMTKKSVSPTDLARISQAFPSRSGQESVNYESAQFLSGDGELKHIEVNKNEHARSLPAIGSRSGNKLAKCGLVANLWEVWVRHKIICAFLLIAIIVAFGRPILYKLDHADDAAGLIITNYGAIDQSTHREISLFSLNLSKLSSLFEHKALILDPPPKASVDFFEHLFITWLHCERKPNFAAQPVNIAAGLILFASIILATSSPWSYLKKQSSVWILCPLIIHFLNVVTKPIECTADAKYIFPTIIPIMLIISESTVDTPRKASVGMRYLLALALFSFIALSIFLWTSLHFN